MKVTPKAYEALAKSVAKWAKICATKEDEYFEKGRTHCPCCQAFDLDGNKNCEGCPIKQDTEAINCVGTPYQETVQFHQMNDRARVACGRELQYLAELLADCVIAERDTKFDRIGTAFFDTREKFIAVLIENQNDIAIRYKVLHTFNKGNAAYVPGQEQVCAIDSIRARAMVKMPSAPKPGLLDDYDAVAFRLVKAGEQFLSNTGGSILTEVTAADTDDPHYMRLVVKKKGKTIVLDGKKIELSPESFAALKKSLK